MAQEDDTLRTTPGRREAVAAFYSRGEQAWQDYLRTGVASSTEAVFARLDALVAAHKDRFLRDSLGKQSPAGKLL